VEGDLRKEIQMNIRRLIEIQAYRGIPAPPQPAGARPADAHNARTRKGPRRGAVRRRRRSSARRVSFWPCRRAASCTPSWQGPQISVCLRNGVNRGKGTKGRSTNAETGAPGKRAAAAKRKKNSRRSGSAV